MQCVGTGLGDDIEERTRRVAVFGGVLVGNDLKLLDGIFRHQAYGAANDVVIEIAAIHADGGTARRRSARDHTAI